MTDTSPRPDPQRHYLSRLFEPASVAIVGASERAGSMGRILVGNMQAAGFRGALFGVNPRHLQVLGVSCYPSLPDLPQAVDLAVIATPAPTIPGIIADCGRAGVRAAVVITAGFGETGAAGAAIEQQILMLAREHGVRIVGPNCLGLLRPAIGLNASFAAGQARAGGTALISQSGAVCTAMLDWAEDSGAGFSSVISMGASVDVGFGEILDYLAADPATRQILLYIEGVRDASRFLGSLRAAARAKPVIVMKVGRHPVASRAAVSHTGAIVGGDDVFEAALALTAAVRVDTFGELLAVTQALDAGVQPCGERLAVITNGGGPGVMAADRAAGLQLPLAELAPATKAALQQALPAHWSHGNPVDLIGDADGQRYGAAVTACVADQGVDGLLVILTPQAMTRPEEAAAAVIQAAATTRKPLLACWMGEHSVGEARRMLRKAGIPVFRTPEAAVEAFDCLARVHGKRLSLQVMPPPLNAAKSAPDLAAARAIVDAALAQDRALLHASEARALLRAFQIPVLESRPAGSAQAAAAAADALGYPVAMKIRSPQITHKSDVRGVRLDLGDAAAVRLAYESMLAGAARLRPDAVLEGVDIEPMAAGGRELLVGVIRDPVFGPAITFGAGGTAVEILRDRSVCLPPLNSGLAAGMIDATRVAKLLGPFRGAPAARREAIVDVLERVSEMACELPELLELDINPLLVDERRAVVLDARIVISARPRSSAAESGSHLAIRPYPRHLAAMFSLSDGTVVTLRPIRAEDAQMEQRFVGALSERSSALRFMQSLHALTPELLARFADIDYARDMAFIATVIRESRETELGVARYISYPDGVSGEFAIVVADAWQGKGLGSRLLKALFAAARSQGLKRLTGQVRPDNLGMLGLCRRHGMDISPWVQGDGARTVSLTL